MSSQYDDFWQGHLSLVKLAIKEAATKGVSQEFDVSAIEKWGDRGHWYGAVEVSSAGIKKAQMAHAKSLGNLIVANRLLENHAGKMVRLMISDRLKLRAFIVSEGHEALKSISRGLPSTKTPVSFLEPAVQRKASRPAYFLASRKLSWQVYQLLARLPRYDYKLADIKLPKNGIYIFFQSGEDFHLNSRSWPRIVRIGINTTGSFRQRLQSHFGRSQSLGGNRNGSVFRKHLGEALMRKEGADYQTIDQWLDKEGPKFSELERRVSELLRGDFTFCFLEVDNLDERKTFERKLIALFSQAPLGTPSANWLGLYAKPAIRNSGLWNVNHVNDTPLSAAGMERFHALIPGRSSGSEATSAQTLVIVPCGQGKIWDKKPGAGVTIAKSVYTGAPFKVNRGYAENFGDHWVILSAKYGFIEPDFEIPETYNVTFKKKSTEPIDEMSLRQQAARLGLYDFSEVVGLGGKEYRAVVKAVFSGKPGVQLSFPFAGLPLGLAMQAIKQEIATKKAQAQSTDS